MSNRAIRDLTVLVRSYEAQLKVEYKILDKMNVNDPIKLQDKIDEIREMEAALEATKEQIDSIEVE